MTSPEHTTAYLSLGSNIAPVQNLNLAVTLLMQRCEVLAVSSAYHTPPQGYTQQPDFINMAVKVRTTLPPQDFKAHIIQHIEQALGRERDPHNKNAPRTIDLDISLWDDAVLTYGDKPWSVPDPDILTQAHVALPLAEIAPHYRHPITGDTLAQIANRFDTQNIYKESFVMPPIPMFIVNPEGAIWHKGRYLTIVRGAGEDHAAGVLAFIGGKAEADITGNALLENTVQREIMEEVGLTVSDLHYAFSQTFSTAAGLPVLFVIFLCRYAGGAICISNPDEVAEALWLTPDEILQHPACPPWMPDHLAQIERQRQTLGW